MVAGICLWAVVVQTPVEFQGMGESDLQRTSIALLNNKDILSKDYQYYDPLRDKQLVNCKEALRARKVNEINCCTVPVAKLLTRVVVLNSFYL